MCAVLSWDQWPGAIMVLFNISLSDTHIVVILDLHFAFTVTAYWKAADSTVKTKQYTWAHSGRNIVLGCHDLTYETEWIFIIVISLYYLLKDRKETLRLLQNMSNLSLLSRPLNWSAPVER